MVSAESGQAGLMPRRPGRTLYLLTQTRSELSGKTNGRFCRTVDPSIARERHAAWEASGTERDR